MEVVKEVEMLIILFLLLYATLYIYITKEKTYYLAIIVFVSIIYISNEFFSILYCLDYKHLKILYCTLIITMSGVIGWKLYKKRNFKTTDILQQCFKLFKENKLLLLFIPFFGMMLGLAIYTVPYNWDSMTYHLPRIAQWAQNKSVAHYAVGDVRQVTSPPLAEFINLQVYIMSGYKDAWFNLLQYTAFVTNASLIYFITKRLGGIKSYAWFSVLLFISMPIAFGEALSTQVDHFSTLWLLMFIYYLLDILQPDYRLCLNKDSIYNVVILSSCIAFGYLAKPSIMFAMLFFALWLLGVCIYRKDSIRDIVSLIVLAVAIIVIIIFPEILRNFVSFSAMSDPMAGARQLIGTINPVYMLVNGIKNYAMNLPNIYFEYTEFIEHTVYWIAYILNVEINNHAIAEDGREFYLHNAATYGHDTAINPIIVVTATLTLIWMIIRRIKREKIQFYEIYSLVSIVSFLVFCVVLRWEPFVTRYMLSYLAILCPAVIMWLANMNNRKWAYMSIGIISFLCIAEIANLTVYHSKICESTHRDQDRMTSYFYIRSYEEDAYRELIKILNEEGFEELGLYLASETYEYPIWAMLEKETRIENVLVSNNTAKYVDSNFVPEAIVVIGREGNDVANYQNEKYICYKQINDSISLWTSAALDK